jgi:chromosome segregation ATPase
MNVMEKTGSSTQAVSEVYEAYKAEQAKKASLQKRIGETEATYKAALAEYTEASGLDDEEWKAKASGEMKTLKQDIERLKAELEQAETSPLRTLTDVKAEAERQEAALREQMSTMEAEIARLKDAYLDAVGQLGDAWRDLYDARALLHGIFGGDFSLHAGIAPEPMTFLLDEKELARAYGQKPSVLTHRLR